MLAEVRVPLCCELIDETEGPLCRIVVHHVPPLLCTGALGTVHVVHKSSFVVNLDVSIDLRPRLASRVDVDKVGETSTRRLGDRRGFRPVTVSIIDVEVHAEIQF